MEDPRLEDTLPIMLQVRVDRLQQETEDLRKDLDALRAERVADEKRRLKAGVAALGSAVLALLGAVWWLLPPSAQHAWELLRGGRPQ
jgi:ferric-dicitrate binding protein FerR (iron transport regulator)